jgi:microcystin-dependent protein
MSSIQFDKDSIKYTNNSNRRIIQDSVLPRCGTVCMWAGNVEPANAMFCDGSSLNKNSYPDLFTVIEYRYGGSGDNFNLPDFRNRYIFGNTSESNNSSYTTGNWEIQNFNHVHELDISSIDKKIKSLASTIEAGSSNNATKYSNNQSMAFTVEANTTDAKQKYIPYYTLCNYIIYY